MSRYITLETEADVEVEYILECIGVDRVREWLNDNQPTTELMPSLDDPVVLLGVIVELRALGYIVEPGGQS